MIEQGSTPGSDVRIAPASWRDFSAVRELEEVCFPMDAWPWIDLLATLSFNNIVRFKAERRRELVGFVAGDIKRYQNIGWIATICVHPEVRGQGIGKVLLEQCEHAMGMPKIKLSVRISNQAAIEMYYRAGYQKAGVWKRYYKGGEDALVMEKNILPIE